MEKTHSGTMFLETSGRTQQPEDDHELKLPVLCINFWQPSENIIVATYFKLK